MNLREKLGQRFVYALPDVTALTEEVADFLVDCYAGGVVLFGFNIKTPEQIGKFNRDLQELAAKHGLPPFMISLDEEGGEVSRMPAEGQDLIAPSQMAQAVGGPEVIKTCSEVTARRLRHLGFNLNYAPVMDINNNPDNPVIGIRSYGAKPEVVAESGAIAIEAYLQNGISPCVKHFPGHGDTNIDSHFGLPVVDKSLEELRQFELIAFERAIAAGVPAIMTAHILYPQVEKAGLPATFSPVLLSQVLRQQMKFEGLIFTDCLDMRAIADRYDLGEAAIMAFRAGVDVVMLKGPLAEQRAAFETALAAAQAGEFDVSDCDEVLGRIEKWRERFCQTEVIAAPSVTDYELIAEASRKSITIVNSKNNLLPLTKVGAKRPLLIDFTLEMASPVEEGRRPGPLLEEQLRLKLPNLLRLEISVAPTEDEVQRVHAWASQSDLLIVVTRHARQLENQARLVRELVTGTGSSAPVVMIAAREPYDMDLFPDVPVAILTYGDAPATIKALAVLLTEG